MMKSYQFFRINKRFHKEREKTFIQQSVRIEKLGKVGICFITGCFYEALNMKIFFFFFNRSFCVQDIFFYAQSQHNFCYDIRMTQEGK